MPQLTNRIACAPLAAALVLGGLGLSACATKGYVNDQIATVNTRIDAVDRKASDALARADAAGAAANGAATDARTANQRLDQLTARVDALEARPVRRPRNYSVRLDAERRGCPPVGLRRPGKAGLGLCDLEQRQCVI
jgi:hypothetical protein